MKHDMNHDRQQLRQLVFSNPVVFLAFGFGSGLMSRAPGTAGTLAAVPFAILLLKMPMAWQLVTVAVAFVVGVMICERSSQLLGKHDHPGIVWDEFVGYWVACLLAPPGWIGLLAAFVLFRFFDILKTWPISLTDRKLGGGFGIMLDDLLAGVFSLVIFVVGSQFGFYQGP